MLSAYLFYKIILLRFKSTYLALFGFLIFIFSPRIFGNIFFDNKDILFLSFLTINFFYFQKYYENKSIKKFNSSFADLFDKHLNKNHWNIITYILYYIIIIAIFK